MTGSRPASVDVALIGAGIMSATLGTLIQHLEPDWSIAVYETRDGVAEESSNAWNNSGTGHAGLCELDYAGRRPGGGLDVTRSVQVGEMFHVSRQFWASLVAAGRLPSASAFLHPTPHMAFVSGEDDVQFLRRWHQSMASQPLFAGMGFSDERHRISQWSRALIDGRRPGEAIAATFEASGTEVDFGVLAAMLLGSLAARDAQLRLGHRVTRLYRSGKDWRLVHHSPHGAATTAARFVFVGAGGGSLQLLQSAGVREVAGHAGFPVSGKFFLTYDPQVVAQHRVKAYGRARVGMPSMGAPHLDHRTVDGRESVMFGPYAGLSSKFLKYGSLWDLPRSLRGSNLGSLLAVARDNPALLRYLAGEVMATRDRQMRSLEALMPAARAAAWKLVTAGQRVQIINRGPTGRGRLQFGTELVTPSGSNLAGLLGASPGASTAVPIMIDVLKRCFPDRMDRWTPRLNELVPSHGRPLNTTAAWARDIRRSTAEVLGLGGV
jgi:malate:quinone-oxidoreductase